MSISAIDKYTLHTAYYTPNQTCVVWRVNLAKSRMSRVNAASVTLEHQTADVMSQAADYKAKTYHTPRQLVHLIPNNSITHCHCIKDLRSYRVIVSIATKTFANISH